jgi:hypothetical protein
LHFRAVSTFSLGTSVPNNESILLAQRRSYAIEIEAGAIAVLSRLAAAPFLGDGEAIHGAGAAKHFGVTVAQI